MRRLTALLALMASLIGPRAQAADVPTSPENYYVGDWTWCDVHVLAQVWSTSEQEAAARLSRKIDDGLGGAAQAALDARRSEVEATGWAVCPYYELFTYEDAEALAGMWGTDLSDAKARIESHILWHQEYKVTADLKAAAMGGMSDGGMVGEDPVSVFYDYGFTYCDAEVLAATWKKEVWDAKVWIGERKIEGNWMAIAKKMGKARKKQAKNQQVCDFQVLDWTVEDADLMAEAWGISRGEAMERMETFARKGEPWTVDQELKARRAASHDGMD